MVHEDDRLLVVSKPSGMLAHPAGLTFTYGLVGIARAARPDHVVDLAHRLDRETSGINVLTKDKQANAFLKKAFFEKLPKKTYHAIVHGSPDWETCTVDGAIGHAPGSAIRIRRGITEDGLTAKTDVRVLKRMGKLSLVSASHRLVEPIRFACTSSPWGSPFSATRCTASPMRSSCTTSTTATDPS